MGFIETRDRIRGSRSSRGDHHSQFASRPRIAIGCVGARLFMANINDFGFTQPIDGIHDWHVVNTDDAEDMLYFKLRQCIGY